MSKPTAELALLRVIDGNADRPLDARQIDLLLADQHRPAGGNVLEEILRLEALGLLERHPGGVGFRWSLTEFGRGVLHGLQLALEPEAEL